LGYTSSVSGKPGSGADDFGIFEADERGHGQHLTPSLVQRESPSLLRERLRAAAESDEKLGNLGFAELMFASADACTALSNAQDQATKTKHRENLARIARAMGVGVYTFGYYLGKNQFSRFPPLLAVDPDLGYVTNKNSEFFGLGNAEDEVQFISLFFFFVLVHIARVHPKSLARGIQPSLGTRAEVAIEMMQREDGREFTFADLLKKVFDFRMSALAILFAGDGWLYKVFTPNADKSKRPLLGRFHVSLLGITVMTANLKKIAEFMASKNLTNKPFRVTGLRKVPRREVVLTGHSMTEDEMGLGKVDLEAFVLG